MRAAVLAVVLVAWTVVACSHGASPPPPDPIANRGSAAVYDAAPADASACVADCIARNQMRAVGIQVIEAECRRDCGATP